MVTFYPYRGLPRREIVPRMPEDASGGGLRLTARELEIVARVIEGDSDRDIAARLCLSVRTVNTHVANAMEKAGARSRTHLAVLVLRAGLVPLRPCEVHDDD